MRLPKSNCLVTDEQPCRDIGKMPMPQYQLWIQSAFRENAFQERYRCFRCGIEIDLPHGGEFFSMRYDHAVNRAA